MNLKIKWISFGCRPEFAARVTAAAANLEITKSLFIRLAIEKFISETEVEKNKGGVS